MSDDYMLRCGGCGMLRCECVQLAGQGEVDELKARVARLERALVECVRYAASMAPFQWYGPIATPVIDEIQKELSDGSK